MSQKIYIKVGDRKWPVPAWLTGAIVGVNEDTVRKIRNGERSNETDNGQMVELVDQLIPDQINPIIEHLKKIVPIDNKPQSK